MTDENHLNESDANVLKGDPLRVWKVRGPDRIGWVGAWMVLALFIGYWFINPLVFPPHVLFPIVVLLVPGSVLAVVGAIPLAVVLMPREVRIGRDGVYGERERRMVYLPWSQIRRVEVSGKRLRVDLHDGGTHTIRLPRRVTDPEQTDLQQRIPGLRGGMLQTHPLALRENEDVRVWLARIKNTSPGVAAYRQAPEQRDELLACASNVDMVASARLGALVRLHLLGVGELRDLEDQIANQHAVNSVAAAFRGVELGDGLVLSFLVRAQREKTLA